MQHVVVELKLLEFAGHIHIFLLGFCQLLLEVVVLIFKLLKLIHTSFQSFVIKLFVFVIISFQLVVLLLHGTKSVVSNIKIVLHAVHLLLGCFHFIVHNRDRVLEVLGVILRQGLLLLRNPRHALVTVLARLHISTATELVLLLLLHEMHVLLGSGHLLAAKHLVLVGDAGSHVVDPSHDLLRVAYQLALVVEGRIFKHVGLVCFGSIVRCHASLWHGLHVEATVIHELVLVHGELGIVEHLLLGLLVGVLEGLIFCLAGLRLVLPVLALSGGLLVPLGAFLLGRGRLGWLLLGCLGWCLLLGGRLGRQLALSLVLLLFFEELLEKF